LQKIFAFCPNLNVALCDRARELAVFDMAIDCKLRSCDMVKLLARYISSTVRYLGVEVKDALDIAESIEI
jgi:hypothetical protein